MIPTENLGEKLQEIARETKLFEIALRTSFTVKNPNNHLVVQRVNTQCSLLKRKVHDVTRDILEKDYGRARSVIESAVFYIGKYEQVLERGLLLDGDIIVLAAKTPQELGK